MHLLLYQASLIAPCAHIWTFLISFFTSEVKDFIYTETVRFAEQALASSKEYLDNHRHAHGNDCRRNPMDRNEVNLLLTIIITMGVVGYPTLR